jgi:FkbM family methyltransferase
MIDIFTDKKYSHLYGNGLPRPQPSDFATHFFNGKENGFFLDVGANDGITCNNSLSFELNYNWDGICIEPHPVAFSKLIKERKCKCLNFALSDKSGEFDFLRIEGSAEMLSGLVDKFDSRHLERINSEVKNYNDKTSINKIECKTITQILNESNKNIIDYLSIDTEGSEIQIINGIDLEKIDITLISMEVNYELNPVIEFMKTKNYKFLQKICGDAFFTKN